MRTWTFIVATVAIALGALGWCAQAVAEGGPAILDPSPVSAALDGGLAVLTALFLFFWLSAIIALSVAEPDMHSQD